MRFGFTKIFEDPGREIVFGLAGQFWRPFGGLRHLGGAEAFEAFAEDGCLKAAWNLKVVASGEGVSDVETETRVQCFGAGAKRKFRLYWTLVGPFSGLLRRELLAQVERLAMNPQP